MIAQGTIDLLGVDMTLLSVENEVVLSDAEVDSHVATQQDEGDDVCISSLADKEELVRVAAIADCAPKLGKPMEDNQQRFDTRREQLVDNFSNDADNTKDKGN